MMKRILSCLTAAALCLGLSAPAFGWSQGFSDYGGSTSTKVEYFFNTDDSVLVYSGEVTKDWDYLDEFYAGSNLYVPIYAVDTSQSDMTEKIATDKQMKNDKLEISHKVLQGSKYIDNVTLISGKKEKIKDLPAGMYAKIEFTDDYLPLTKTRLAVRLVISVNGVSYQDTAVTFNCDLMNRREDISRNSVYGALSPTQYKVASNYRGEATFDLGGGALYTARVAARENYYINLDRTPDEQLTELYPDVYMEFYNFKGENDTFESTGELVLPIDEQKFKEKKTSAQLYVYEIQGDTLKALTQNTVSYDSKAKKLTLSTKTLRSYVLSSRALMKEVGKAQNDNILRSGYAESATEENADEPTEPTNATRRR